MRKEEKEDVKVRQVPILMEDGWRVVQKTMENNGDSSVPNMSADFQKEIEDFVQKREGGVRSSNGFTKRIFFQSTEEIEEVTSRSRKGLTSTRGWDRDNDDEDDEESSSRQSRRSLPPEAGVRAIFCSWTGYASFLLYLVQFVNHIKFMWWITRGFKQIWFSGV